MALVKIYPMWKLLAFFLQPTFIAFIVLECHGAAPRSFCVSSSRMVASAPLECPERLMVDARRDFTGGELTPLDKMLILKHCKQSWTQFSTSRARFERFWRQKSRISKDHQEFKWNTSEQFCFHSTLTSTHLHIRWVFPKIGVPKNGWFIMENPY